MKLIEENNLIDSSTLQSLSSLFYLFIAVIAGGSQFAVALYYRSAEVKPKA